MMKIRYLPNEEKLKIRYLYEKIFDDSEVFVDYFFSGPVYSHDVLVLEVDDEIVSMLQLVPKDVVYRGERCIVHYIYAVATDDNYRKCGYMERLLEKTFEDLKQKGEPFTYLVPVNPDVYKKFGFRMSYLKPKYGLNLEPGQIKVYHPNRMDSAIAAKLCSQILPAKYDTYLVHNEAYFDKIFKELEIEKGYLVYHTEGERLKGYSLVASDDTVIESVFSVQPKELSLKGYTPWVMVKALSEDCRIGRLYINDET